MHGIRLGLAKEYSSIMPLYSKTGLIIRGWRDLICCMVSIPIERFLLKAAQYKQSFKCYGQFCRSLHYLLFCIMLCCYKDVFGAIPSISGSIPHIVLLVKTSQHSTAKFLYLFLFIFQNRLAEDLFLPLRESINDSIDNR